MTPLMTILDKNPAKVTKTFTLGRDWANWSRQEVALKTSSTMSSDREMPDIGPWDSCFSPKNRRILKKKLVFS